MVCGIVCELHRWPVKSMAGEPVDVLRIDGRGAAGDRTHAVWDVERDKRLTAREAPRLLAWRAAYRGADGDATDPAAPPRATVTAPDGTQFDWDDPALPAALATDLGREVSLRRDVAGQQDLADSLLVTTTATLAALGDELAEPLDLRRFRTNVHAKLDAAGYAEHGWEGRTLRVGEAELALLHPCERCVIPTIDPDSRTKSPHLLRHLARTHDTLFGINARPRGPATIRVGDRVELR